MAKNLKVLVVDDNEEFCQNTADILELKDYHVAVAHDGFEAIEMARKDVFGAVLMDIKMPRMDGVETLRQLKEIAPQIQAVMMTAYSVEDLVADALRQGAFGFLKKPLDFDRLFGIMGNIIPDGARVLVVDDDRDLCSNMESILGDQGFRVSLAYNGSTALEKMRENNFDIILLDMKLPPANGLQTYLAAQDIRPKVTAIFITGYPQEMEDIAQQALQKGAYACMEKPIDMDKLTLLLEQITKGKSQGALEKPQ